MGQADTLALWSASQVGFVRLQNHLNHALKMSLPVQAPDPSDQAILDALRSIPVAPIIDEMTRMGYPGMLMGDVHSHIPLSVN